jgi:hypothetical protein
MHVTRSLIRLLIFVARTELFRYLCPILVDKRLIR